MELLRLMNGSPPLSILVEFPERAFSVWKFPNTLKSWLLEAGYLFRADDPIGIAIAQLFVEDVMQQYKASSIHSIRSKFLSSSIRRQLDYFGGLDQVIQSLTSQKQTKQPDDSTQWTTSNRNVKLAPQNQWKDVKNIRQFLDSVGKDRLYSLSMRDLRMSGGTQITNPSHSHCPLTFPLPRLNSSRPSPLPCVLTNFINYVATNLSRYHSDNLHKVILQHYPDLALQTWRFSKTPDLWWDDVADLWKNRDPVATSVVLDYLTYLVEKIAAKYPVPESSSERSFEGTYVSSYLGSDAPGPYPLDIWYILLPQLNYKKFQAEATIAAKFGGLVPMLKRAYPLYKWSPEQLSKHSNTSSQVLLNKLATGLL